MYNILQNDFTSNYFINKIYSFWGLGIGDWGLGPIPNPQSPIPNLYDINYNKNKFYLSLFYIEH